MWQSLRGATTVRRTRRRHHHGQRLLWFFVTTTCQVLESCHGDSVNTCTDRQRDMHRHKHTCTCIKIPQVQRFFLDVMHICKSRQGEGFYSQTTLQGYMEDAKGRLLQPNNPSGLRGGRQGEGFYSQTTLQGYVEDTKGKASTAKQPFRATWRTPRGRLLQPNNPSGLRGGRQGEGFYSQTTLQGYVEDAKGKASTAKQPFRATWRTPRGRLLQPNNPSGLCGDRRSS